MFGSEVVDLVIIGGVLVAALSGGVGWCLFARRKRRSKKEEHDLEQDLYPLW
jgi:hypothetical protein